jgi:tetratricopeptide (TPR) repeat protein
LTDLFYAARESYHNNEPDSIVRARRLLYQILQADPEFSEAYAYLAAIYWSGFDRDWARMLGLDEQQTLDLAWVNLTESLKAPLPLTYEVQARMLAWEGEYAAAQEAAERARQMDPNDPVGRLTMAIVLIYRGQMKEAVEHLEHASNVDPLNSADYLFWNGLAQYLLKNYSEATALLRRSAQINRYDDWTRLVLAASLGQQGKAEQARQEIETMQLLRRRAGVPAYSLRYLRYWSFERDAERLHLCEGLAKAGLTGRCERSV